MDIKQEIRTRLSLVLLLLCGFSIYYVCLLSASEAPIIISLGIDCEGAIATKDYGLRHEACPFDQLVTQFNSLYALFENKFDSFLLKENLILSTHPMNARYGDPHTVYVVETKYDILFRHHFEFSDKYLDNYDEIKQMFDRRIARMYELINSGHEIYFLRKCMTHQEAQQFVNLLDKQFPSLKYKLIVVNFKDQWQEQWTDAKIANFYIIPFMGTVDAWWGWWQRSSQWKEIFQHLKLI